MLRDKERFYLLDLLRGIAVFLMVLAHSVYLFHDSSSPFLNLLQNFGNAVAFTTFLLVSGTVAYIAYLRPDISPNYFKKRTRNRFLFLLFTYYLVALFALGSKILTTYGLARWKIILDVLSFRTVPSFVEYIPPFIVFTLFLIFFRKFLFSLAQQVPKAIFYSALIYFVGMMVYRIPVPEFLIPSKALFFGHENWYRFPIFQYFPIYILGLSFGHWIKEIKNLGHKKEIVESLAIISIVGIGISLAIGNITDISFERLFLRWPPTLPFLLLGTAFTFTLGAIFYLTKYLKRIPLAFDSLLVLGQNAYAVFWAHILIFHFYLMASGSKVSSIFLVLILFSFLLLTSLALATFLPFNYRFISLTFIKEDHHREFKEEPPIYQLGEDLHREITLVYHKIKSFFFPRSRGTPKRERLIKRRYILAASILVALISFAFLPSVAQEYEKKTKSAKTPSWWNTNWSYYQPITVRNSESFITLPEDQLVSFYFNHKDLVESRKSLTSGNDIRIVFWDGENFSDLDYWLLSNWNSDKTTLGFKVKESLKPGEESKRYLLYYGNNLAKPVFKINPPPNSWSNTYKVLITTESEISYPILGRLNRLWALKGDGFTKTNDDLVYTLQIRDISLVNPRIAYKIIGVRGERELEKTSENTWEAKVNLENFLPGSYQIETQIFDEENIYKSQKTGFYLSYPLYVTWTIDWEGYDVSDVYLSTMANISERHGIKMTHLFNPRIYTTETISSFRKDYLTKWVKERYEEFGEEIGLHLHMFYDFIKSAGITPKKEPNWGDSGDGYGALTANYNTQEMITILNFAKKLFKDNGLKEPLSFRTGGWFASIETLRALEETGFLLDSSGRTEYSFGPNKLKGFWNLSSTTQPYHPSVSNQNFNSPEPTLGLWEIPNNGADSYWFSGEDMIQRFKDNFAGEPLLEKRQVTYLSHPHWFNQDEQSRIEAVFNYINQFLYSKDLGPLKYVTLSDVYEAWSK